jgi:PPM family protein phosphatase
MAPGWILDMASASDRGKVREQNEDCLVADPELGYAVLADGMGGYNAGEVASRIAVETVESEMRKLQERYALDDLGSSFVEKLLSDQVVAANVAIYRAAQDDRAYYGMGTTLVMALWHGTNIVVAHVGDSRLYRLRGDLLEQVTRDHSLLQEQIDLGLIDPEQARYSPHRNLVTRALGVDTEVDVEVHTYAAEPDDLYLLCSDGLSDMLDERDLATTLRGGAEDLSGTVLSLVQQANDGGGRDNISVILAQLRESRRTAHRSARF